MSPHSCATLNSIPLLEAKPFPFGLSMKISIIGAGKIGSTLAYTLFLRELADEIALVNRTEALAEGEILDLQHGESFVSRRCTIQGGGVDVSRGSDVLVFCLSVPWQKNFTSRFDLAPGNRALLDHWVPPLLQRSPGALLLVITNPVDVITRYLLDLTGLPPSRVFGLGTLIDSARFRDLLAHDFDVHPDDVRAYILGEHGDSQFPLFSMAMAGGRRIEKNEHTLACFEAARQGGYSVIRKKGHTCYAVCLAATYVLESIAYDSLRTMPLSVAVPGILGVDDVCLSLPVTLGRRGVRQVIVPEFSDEEAAAFLASADHIRKHLLSKVSASAEEFVLRHPEPIR